MVVSPLSAEFKPLAPGVDWKQDVQHQSGAIFLRILSAHSSAGKNKRP
jgi:hypothetical protein